MRYRKILIFAFLATLIPGGLWASEAKSKIQEGVKLHDASDYDGAIRAYKAALKIDSSNSEALYELTNTYFEKGDFKSCIASAKAGLKKRSFLDVGFYTNLGSCYSASGKPKKAIESFRAGLDIAPDNANLNLNIAVTLANSGDRSTAIEHLERSIDSHPSYPTPYYFLGRLYREDGKRVQSLFYFTRFVTLEPDSGKAVYAASAALTSLFSGIEVKSEKDIVVTVPIFGKEDPMSLLEYSISMVAASVHAEESAEPLRSEAEQSVAVLLTFFGLASELSESDDYNLQSTVIWNQAMAPIMQIHKRGSSEALGYVMAMLAKIPGALGWVEANPESVADLSRILSELGD